MDSMFSVAVSIILGSAFLLTILSTQENMNDAMVINTLEQRAKLKLINIREIIKEDLLSSKDESGIENSRIKIYKKNSDTTVTYKWENGVSIENKCLKRIIEYSGGIDSTVFRGVEYFNILQDDKSKYYTIEMVVRTLEGFEYKNSDFYGDFLWKGSISPTR